MPLTAEQLLDAIEAEMAPALALPDDDLVALRRAMHAIALAAPILSLRHGLAFAIGCRLFDEFESRHVVRRETAP